MSSNIKKFENFSKVNEDSEYNLPKGISVSVYINADNVDTTGNGVTSKYKRFVLVGENVPKITTIDIDKPYLILKSKREGYMYAVPSEIRDGAGKEIGPMFGGNFVYCSDSRFPNKYPIPVHDRYEVYHP